MVIELIIYISILMLLLFLFVSGNEKEQLEDNKERIENDDIVLTNPPIERWYYYHCFIGENHDYGIIEILDCKSVKYYRAITLPRRKNIIKPFTGPWHTTKEGAISDLNKNFRCICMTTREETDRYTFVSYLQ